MGALSSSPRYRSGEFLIDPNTREIRRGEHTIDVEAKVFDLIALLVERHERVLSKRELNTALWGNRPVTDAALSQQLRKARRALGDDGDAQAVIRTVYGQGLRWVAPVAVEPVADASNPSAPVALPPSPSPSMRTPRKTRLRVLASVAGLLLLAFGILMAQVALRPGGAAAPRRIAVLPVQDQTADGALAWSRVGLMGLMSGLFEQAGRIEVVPAQNVQSVVRPNATFDAASVTALRNALGASHVLVTTLRKLGAVYELDVHLVSAGNAERTGTLHGTDPAALAADAVALARRWLDLAPMPAAAIGISNPFLAEAYARGLDAQLHGDAAAAKKYFSICLDQDPALAWPRLGLATAQSQSGEADASLENATKVAAAAREQDDEELLVPALRLLASLAFFGGDLQTASARIEEAISRVSAQEHSMAMVDLLVIAASIDDERGDAVRARQRFEQALKLARASGYLHGEASALVNLASVDNGAGDVAAAASDLQAGLDAARRSGDSHLENATLGDLAGVEANRGHLLPALALLKRAIALARERGDSNLKALLSSRLVWVMAPFGHDATTRRLGEQLLAAANEAGNPYWQAEAHFALSELASREADWARTLSELEQARAAYAQAGMTRALPEIASLRIDAGARGGNHGEVDAAVRWFREQARLPSQAAQWREWLPLLDAQVRAADGDVAGAAADLTRSLDDARGASGPVEQAGLFQLGRWQLQLGQAAELLARPEWKPWLEQHPDAIELQVAALRAVGRDAEAASAQSRLDALRQAPELDIDPGWLAKP